MTCIARNPEEMRITSGLLNNSWISPDRSIEKKDNYTSHDIRGFTEGLLRGALGRRSDIKQTLTFSNKEVTALSGTPSYLRALVIKVVEFILTIITFKQYTTIAKVQEKAMQRDVGFRVLRESSAGVNRFVKIEGANSSAQEAIGKLNRDFAQKVGSRFADLVPLHRRAFKEAQAVVRVASKRLDVKGSPFAFTTERVADEMKELLTKEVVLRDKYTEKRDALMDSMAPELKQLAHDHLNDLLTLSVSNNFTVKTVEDFDLTTPFKSGGMERVFTVLKEKGSFDILLGVGNIAAKPSVQRSKKKQIPTARRVNPVKPARRAATTKGELVAAMDAFRDHRVKWYEKGAQLLDGVKLSIPNRKRVPRKYLTNAAKARRSNDCLLKCRMVADNLWKVFCATDRKKSIMNFHTNRITVEMLNSRASYQVSLDGGETTQFWYKLEQCTRDADFSLLDEEDERLVEGLHQLLKGYSGLNVKDINRWIEDVGVLGSDAVIF